MLDINSTESWPSSALSNFAEHAFMVDGVECASMEGFLQSLKFEDPEAQRQICLLTGREAKQAGKNQLWWDEQVLFWQGWRIGRHSTEFQQLLNKAFDALARNPEFQEALLATGDRELDHTIGKDDPYRTVLTRQEFVAQLVCLRILLRRQLS